MRPHPPPKPQGVLLPRILAHEKRSIQQLCTDLCFCDLPGVPPLTLGALRWTGAQPLCTSACDLCGNPVLRISIPLCAELCDSCGRRHTACTSIDVETPVRHACSTECGTWFVQPCIALICADRLPDDSCFRVQLRISLEIYLLRLEPCAMPPCRPPCPDLPLYPPPIHPRC